MSPFHGASSESRTDSVRCRVTHKETAASRDLAKATAALAASVMTATKVTIVMILSGTAIHFESMESSSQQKANAEL